MSAGTGKAAAPAGMIRASKRRLGLESNRIRLAYHEAAMRLRIRMGEAVRHLHGPPAPCADDRSLLVLCMLRNAAPWLPTYLRYYRDLGVRHFVFLDNASTDNTRDILCQQNDVSVFYSALSYATYWIVFKRWLVRKFGRGGWSLIADADELFDFPYSSRLLLPDFLSYLNYRGYNAVSVQNLEMVAGEPLSEIQGRDETDLERLYPWYDVSRIRKRTDKYYLQMNRFDSDQSMHTGGIRESGFGWGGSMLTKQALLRYDGEMNLYPYDGHFVTGARIADVTALFKHYKFIGSFYRHMREEIEREEHFGDAQIFKRYAKVLEENPGLCLKGPAAKRYGRAKELLDENFVIASDAFRRWVDAHAGHEPLSPTEG